MKTAAFFDIDGTIYRNSLMIEHFKKMIKYEVFDPMIWYGKVKESFLEWDKRHINYDIYLEELAGIYLEHLKGKNKDHIDFVANQVIELNGEKVYKYSRDRIKYHKDRGDLVFFISGSPDFLATKMANIYGITEVIATEYDVDSKNNFTGTLKAMWDSENKNRAVKELIEKYKVDVESSFSYGDTMGDYSMFKMVGNPVAINPTKELLEKIKSDKEILEKIKIIVERKDVIYDICTNVETVDNK